MVKRSPRQLATVPIGRNRDMARSSMAECAAATFLSAQSECPNVEMWNEPGDSLVAPSSGRGRIQDENPPRQKDPRPPSPNLMGWSCRSRPSKFDQPNRVEREFSYPTGLSGRRSSLEAWLRVLGNWDWAHRRSGQAAITRWRLLFDHRLLSGIHDRLNNALELPDRSTVPEVKGRGDIFLGERRDPARVVPSLLSNVGDNGRQ